MCNSVSCAGNKIHEEENLVTQAEGGTQRGSCSQGKTRNLASSVCDKYVTLSLHTRSHSIQSIVLECLTTTNTFHPYTNLHIHSLASRAGAAPTVLQKLVSRVLGLPPAAFSGWYVHTITASVPLHLCSRFLPAAGRWTMCR